MADAGARVTPRRRLWIISELYAPEETSTGYVLTRIAEGLTDTFDVHVLCGQPTYSARGLRAPVRELRNGVRVRRCAGTTFDKNRLWGRLINFVTAGSSMFVHAMRKFRRRDLVLVVTNPPLLPFLTLIAARVRGASCVLLVHDVYPDVMVATGMIRPGSLWERLGAVLNRWLYGGVDRIVVLGRDMAARARGKLRPTHEDRVTIIPNWADVDDIHPAPKQDNALLRELGWSDCFVVQYAGNMGRPNDLDILIEAAERVRDDEVRFVVIGAGVRQAPFERELRERRLANVVSLGPRPRSAQPVFLNACDVGVVSLVRGMKGIGVPSRLYNILAAGKPVIVIAESDSEPAMTVREIGAGWVVEPRDVDGFVRAIGEARSDPARVALMGERARASAESTYSFRRIARAYRQLFTELNG